MSVNKKKKEAQMVIGAEYLLCRSHDTGSLGNFGGISLQILQHEGVVISTSLGATQVRLRRNSWDSWLQSAAWRFVALRPQPGAQPG